MNRQHKVERLEAVATGAAQVRKHERALEAARHNFYEALLDCTDRATPAEKATQEEISAATKKYANRGYERSRISHLLMTARKHVGRRNEFVEGLLK